MAFSSENTLAPNLISNSNGNGVDDNSVIQSFGNQNHDLDENQDEDFGNSTELRGTIFWAPPRPQLILKIHKKQR